MSLFKFIDFDINGVIYQTIKGPTVTTRFLDRRGISFAQGDHIGLISNCVGKPFVYGIGIVVKPNGRMRYDVYVVKQAPQPWLDDNRVNYEGKVINMDSWQLVHIRNSAYEKKYKDIFENPLINSWFKEAIQDQIDDKAAENLTWKYMENGPKGGYFNLETSRRLTALKRKRKGKVWIYSEDPKLAYPAEMEGMAQRVRKKIKYREERRKRVEESKKRYSVV